MTRIGWPIYKSVQRWCSENGWTKPFRSEGQFWAFPPDAVAPSLLPLGMRELQRQELAFIKCLHWAERNYRSWFIPCVLITFILAVCDPRSRLWIGWVSIPSLHFFQYLLFGLYICQCIYSAWSSHSHLELYRKGMNCIPLCILLLLVRGFLLR